MEKLTSKEKSSGSKLVAVGEKSPFKLTPSMLRGQALRSMEDVSSSELLLNVQDDHKFESRSNATLLDVRDSTSQEPNSTSLDVRDSTSQKQGKVEENGPLESCVPSDTRHPVINSDSAVSLKASGVRIETSDSAVENGVSPPQNKRAFRMSALEDYVELDDDLPAPCNGFASPPFSEGRGQLEAHVTDSKLSPAGEPKLVKATIDDASVGEGSNPASEEEATAASQSALLPPSVAAFDKPNETNNRPPVFSFSSKVADKFPSLMPESSSSLLNISAPTVSSVKIPEPEKGGHLKALAAEDRNGKSDTVPCAASNGPLVSSSPAGSFTAAAFNNTNQISTSDPVIFTPSTSISNFVPSGTGDITLTTSTSSILGAAATPTIFGELVFKFGASLDPPTKVSAGSTSIIPAAGDLDTKAVTDSTANSVGTVSQGTSVQSFSFASPPSSNTNSSTCSVSSLSSSTNAAPVVFNSSMAPSSSPLFSITAPSASVLPSPSPSLTQPVSGSLEFNAGSSFSLDSGRGDKSGRMIVKISRSKNRKK